MKKFSLIVFAFILLLAFSLLVFSAAALGDDVDLGGGDTGGGWDSGGTDDWGGGGTGGWDDNGGGWGNDGGWSGSGGWGDGAVAGGFSGNSGVVPIVPVGGGTIMIIIAVAVLFYILSQRRGTGGSMGGSARRIDPVSLQALQAKDAKFSCADIEAKVKNWVLQFESAWASGDMTSCRPFLSDGLYNTYQMQLDLMKKNGEASRTEDLAVMACNVEKWTQDADKEYLDVWLREKKRTYKVDANNPQNVIKGDRQTTYTLEYRWQLMRSSDSMTENAGIRVMECPNCGAETSVNQSGKCEYCGSTLKAESFDWTLNKVDKLVQTSHK